MSVDPDLLLARDIARRLPTMHRMAAYGIASGYMDDAPEVGAALAAIKRLKIACLNSDKDASR